LIDPGKYWFFALERLDDPRWKKSSVKDCVRVLAGTPAEAREKGHERPPSLLKQ
jgi:hypothetical protein